MVFDSDKTILTEHYQTDWWSIGHVLYFFFLMYADWTWWAALLLCYLYEGYEALPSITLVTPVDGLVVDPLQAYLGIITFYLLQEYKQIDVIQKFPSLNDTWQVWAKYVLSFWYFVFAVTISLYLNHTSQQHKTEWITGLGFTVMALYRLWADKRGVLMVLYVVTYSGFVVGLNRIPYNPFFGSLYFHAPIVLTYFIIRIKKLYKLRKELILEKQLALNSAKM